MSENLDLVRSIYADWERGDFSEADWADPEIEYVNPPSAVEPGTRRGSAAFSRAVASVFDGWETWQMEPERMELFGDHVAVVVRYRARGRGSGVEIEGRESALWTIRDGKVIGYEWFHEPDDAFNAARLEEQPVSANLDLVRWIYVAQESGDWSVGEWAHPEIEFVRVDGPEVGTWRGRERVAEVLRDIVSPWEGFRRRAEEYRELDAERVLVVHRRSGRAKATGLDIEQLDAGTRGAAVVHIRDGRVTRIVAYWDRDRALADLGLEL